MKKTLFSAILIGVLTSSAQNQKIDFRSVDIKSLNRQQLIERAHWLASEIRLGKTMGLQSEVKSVYIQGNKIHSIIFNTGAISSPGVTSNVYDLVWNGLGYGYEFGPLIGARVPKASNPNIDSVSWVIDGFGTAVHTTADGDFAPDGITKWGWLPKPGYSAPGQNDVATWGARTSDLRIRPKSWPESWYNPIVGEYVYPSFLGGNSSVPDEEVFYVVDDSTDAEFIKDYQCMPDNPLHGGLGFNLEVRTMQFANPLAEDVIFLVYTAENDVRSKALPKVFFGMFGDPHIGGAGDYSDDAASFIPARAIGVPAVDRLLIVDGKLTSQPSRNMVYSWDAVAGSDIPSIVPGYFGYKFLESPNNSIDGIDNDDDGLLDESPFNDKGTFIDGINIPLTTGIDNLAKYKAVYGDPKPRWSGDENGNWNKATDDVGIDGIFGTGDYGEGDGVPSQLFFKDLNNNGKLDAGEDTSSVQLPGYAWAGSEPNFGFRDVNESDQIGLRSFWSLHYGGNNLVKNDQLMYDKISSTESDTAALNLLYTTNPANVGDYVFLYGSGPFEMQPGHRERFSIALLMAVDLKDLLLNSETAQSVMAASYRFAQPPPKPKVVAVPGDGRVTLYWDSDAENGLDPFTLKKDFEGYKIYRSRDFTFKDVFSITDGNGYPFLGKALYDTKARKTAQWHRAWTASEKAKYAGGFQPVQYLGHYVKYYMGEPEDSSGLRHEYVDSTVTNGVTYYYAVVSFDHGDDSLQLPPSECQAIIRQNAVTQELKFDVNTSGVVPNALGGGLVSPKPDIQKGVTLNHLGSATGVLQFRVLSEPALKNGTYETTFRKTPFGTDTVLAYNIRRLTPFVEQQTGNENLFINLQNRNLVTSSVRVFNGPDTVSAQIALSSIVVDSAGGRVRANATGILLKTRSYTISYQYYPVASSRNFKNEDSNPVFDGLRPFVIDDSLLIRSAGFEPINGISNITTGSKPSPNSALLIKQLLPKDVRIEFKISLSDTSLSGDYNIPPDSARLLIGSGYVKIPFKATIVGDTAKLVVYAYNENVNKWSKKGRWDVGEDIYLAYPGTVFPPPSGTKIFVHEILTISRTVDSLPPQIPANAVYTILTKKPFSSTDVFTLITRPLQYNSQFGDLALQNVIVVPNPYVVANEFELPSYRPDLRGERVIQFRNLPQECTVRIYTITGELVRTLHKNDLTNYINWDVLSSESARIGYGVYIYHIETPTGATKIGRLGVIK